LLKYITAELFNTNKNISRKILTQCKIYAKITLSNDDRLIENEITRRNKAPKNIEDKKVIYNKTLN